MMRPGLGAGPKSIFSLMNFYNSHDQPFTDEGGCIVTKTSELL